MHAPDGQSKQDHGRTNAHIDQEKQPAGLAVPAPLQKKLSASANSEDSSPGVNMPVPEGRLEAVRFERFTPARNDSVITRKADQTAFVVPEASNPPQTNIAQFMQPETEGTHLPAIRDNMRAFSLPVQKKENNTGLPDHLKHGMEMQSGMDMSDVRVHYNSHKPAQLHAMAYAQGTDIHIGPGQEQHLPHESWHVVQQKQGRVKPSVQLKTSQAINTDPALEAEADVAGARLNTEHIVEKADTTAPLQQVPVSADNTRLPVQRKIGFEFQVRSTDNPHTGLYKGEEADRTKDYDSTPLHEGTGWHLMSDSGDPEIVTKAYEETKSGFDEMQASLGSVLSAFEAWSGETKKENKPLSLNSSRSFKIKVQPPLFAAAQASAGMGFASLLSLMEKLDTETPDVPWRKKMVDRYVHRPILKSSLQAARQLLRPISDMTPAIEGFLVLLRIYINSAREYSRTVKTDLKADKRIEGEFRSKVKYAKQLSPFVLRNTFPEAVGSMSPQEQLTLRKLLAPENFNDTLLQEQIYTQPVNTGEDEPSVPTVTIGDIFREVRHSTESEEDEPTEAYELFTNKEWDDRFSTNIGRREAGATSQDDVKETKEGPELKGAVIELRRLGPDKIPIGDWPKWAASVFTLINSLPVLEEKDAAAVAEEKHDGPAPDTTAGSEAVTSPTAPSSESAEAATGAGGGSVPALTTRPLPAIPPPPVFDDSF